MKKYSITKYNRINNANSQWTSISDIGKIYNSTVVTAEEYQKVEDAYVAAILQIIRYMNITSVKMKNISRWKNLKSEIESNLNYKNLYTSSMLDTYEKVNSSMEIQQDDLCNIIRLQLREDIGGLLYVPYKLKIFIGYDFMMGVHSSKPLETIFKPINEQGLHIYKF